MNNRRQFTRILFSLKALLEVEEQKYPINLLDISLNGALISNPEAELIGKLGTLTFDLDENAPEVTMHVAVIHQHNDEAGLRCNAIDIDSISQIKRLIELNLGDASQLDKELSQLSRLVN